MTKSSLDDRRIALEESFFTKENERLRAQLCAKAERNEDRAELAGELGFNDTGVLDQLLDAGIEAETCLAVTLVPLVRVAWADGNVSPPEREMILRAAADRGITEGSAARLLLDQWLQTRPPRRLQDAWMAYITSLRGSMESSAFEQLRFETLGRSTRVAKAANGLLGRMRGISDSEEAVLDELSRSFGSE